RDAGSTFLRFHRLLRFLPRPQHGVQNRPARVEVQRVAELVFLRGAAGLDAGGHLARVVAAEAALAERAEQIAQRLVAEEVEALVGDLEAVLLGVAHAGAGALAALALLLEIGLAAQVALRLQLLDYLLDQL